MAHCEAQGDRIALIDPPLFDSQPDVIDFGEIQSWRRRFDFSYAALYYPWLLVYDPLARGVTGDRAVLPSGHVAGLIARTDLESGVHRPPANAELRLGRTR